MHEQTITSLAYTPVPGFMPEVTLARTTVSEPHTHVPLRNGVWSFQLQNVVPKYTCTF